jgi:hypothetical protein
MVYIFDRNYGGMGNWGKVQDFAHNYTFGIDSAIEDSIMMIGSPKDPHNGYESGITYIYQPLIEGQYTYWQFWGNLDAYDGDMSDYYGSAIASDGDTFIVGANQEDENGLSAGAVYVYVYELLNKIYTTNDYQVNENEGFVEVEVSIDTSPLITSTSYVSFTTIDGTALSSLDYLPISGMLSFEPGTITQTISIPILDDELYERYTIEFFGLELSNPINAILGEPYTTTIIINDNDNYELWLPMVTHKK